MGGYADGEQSIRRGLAMQAARRARLHTDSITRSTATSFKYPFPSLADAGLAQDDLCACGEPLVLAGGDRWVCPSGKRDHSGTAPSPRLIRLRRELLLRSRDAALAERAARRGGEVIFEREDEVDGDEDGEQELDA